MTKRLALLPLLWLCFLAHARTPVKTGEYLELRPGQFVYVEVEPARAGKPTLWFLNALTYTTRDWDSFVARLKDIDPELGFVRLDLEGQGRTYKKNPLRRAITLDDQVILVAALHARLKLAGEQIAVGESYGGAVAMETLAQHPDLFKNVIAISPYVETLAGRDCQTGSKLLVNCVRGMGVPEWIVSDQQIDTWAFGALMFSVFPLAEIAAWENYPSTLSSLVMMSLGIRDWTAASRAHLFPPGKLHLSASRYDTYVQIAQIEKFVEALPADRLGSYTLWDYAGHKLIEEQPGLAAAYVHAILTHNLRFTESRHWRVNPIWATPKSLLGEGGFGCAASLR